MSPDRTSKVHSGSHRELVRYVPTAEAPMADVDAIIVPTSRTAPYLREAIRLAMELDCLLIVLCSQRARAADVEALVRGIEGSARLSYVAIDVPRDAGAALPAFASTKLLAPTIFHRRTDTSLKRNLGLTIARILGWGHTLFLDDDVRVPDALDLKRTAGLLENHGCVGMNMGGFPDNSVVCHANRRSGGFQETFVGGGALAVAYHQQASYFPNIYNEDWFFLLSEDKLPPVAVTGHATQAAFDPFAHPERARGEEFGDNIAEGLFWLLDKRGDLGEASSPIYWRNVLGRRRAFINEVIRYTLDSSDVDPDERRPMLGSLKAARARTIMIDPQLCVDYVEAWRRDRTSWNFFMQGHVKRGLPGALEALRLLGMARGKLNGKRLDSRVKPAPHAPDRDLAPVG